MANGFFPRRGAQVNARTGDDGGRAATADAQAAARSAAEDAAPVRSELPGRPKDSAMVLGEVFSSQARRP
jgi:hypothetical protein